MARRKAAKGTPKRVTIAVDDEIAARAEAVRQAFAVNGETLSEAKLYRGVLVAGLVVAEAQAAQRGAA